MIATKLVTASKKQLEVKSPYVKPIYKSYKQLLNLDRPKKNIFQQSEGENDNFLEKLLKEEKKKKKKHSIKKKNAIKVVHHTSDNLENNQQFLEDKHIPHQEIIAQNLPRDSSTSKQKEGSRLNIDTPRDTVFELNTRYQLSRSQQLFKKRKPEENPENQKQRERKDKSKGKGKGKTENQLNYKTSTIQRDVYIDEASRQLPKYNGNPFVIANKALKTATAFNQLRQELTKLKNSEQIITKLQGNQVIHILKPVLKDRLYKANSLSRIGQQQLPPFKRESIKETNDLFKTLRQEQIFIASLKNFTGKKTRF